MEQSIFNEAKSIKPSPSMLRKLSKFIVIGIIAIIVFFSSYKRISVGYIGLVERLGSLTDNTLQEGPHFVIPFVDKVIKLNTRVQDLPETQTQGELAGRETIQLTIQSKYRLDVSKARDVYRTAGANYIDYLVPQAEFLDVVKSVISQYSIENFAQERMNASTACLEALNERFTERGIIFTSFAISNYNFDSSMEAAISEMNAAAQRQRTQEIQIATEKERAEADKQIAITNAEKEAEVQLRQAQAEAEAIRLQAEAEAEANAKISASLTDELIRYNEVQKWNGSRATIITSGSVITDTTGANNGSTSTTANSGAPTYSSAAPETDTQNKRTREVYQ